MFFRTKRILFNILSSILATLTVLIGFFAVVVVTLNIVYIKTNVVGDSMLPTLNTAVAGENVEGDVVYINQFKACEINNIVVAKVNGKYIIKRLVGKPGDIVEIRDNGDVFGVYVNEELLYTKTKTYAEENNIGSSNSYYNKYLAFLQRPENAQYVGENSSGVKCIKLKEDQYCLFGDNWGKSSDSLEFGMLHKKDLVGVVDVVVPADEKEDSYILKFILNLFKV